MKLPPWDSTVRLAPGSKFVLDGEVDAEWHNKTAVLRTARGTILALSVEVEQTLDRIITRFFFPTSLSAAGINVEDIRSLFDESLLKTPSASLNRKIQVFKGIVKQGAIASVLPTDLLSKLERLKDLRNRFAHYPVTFDPSDGQTKEKLIARLVCKDKEIILDEKFFTEADELFTSTQQDLQKVASVVV